MLNINEIKRFLLPKTPEGSFARGFVAKCKWTQKKMRPATLTITILNLMLLPLATAGFLHKENGISWWWMLAAFFISMILMVGWIFRPGDAATRIRKLYKWWIGLSLGIWAVVLNHFGGHPVVLLPIAIFYGIIILAPLLA